MKDMGDFGHLGRAESFLANTGVGNSRDDEETRMTFFHMLNMNNDSMSKNNYFLPRN